MGNLATPPSVQKLQTALHAKAKGEPSCRFHALYDKLHREDVLRHAYQCCRANHGAPGVDEVRFEDIEADGVEPWLGELAKRLKEKRYQADAIRRVYIPKPNGKLRPLGIPTIRDRVVQMAMGLVIGPIFEADLPPEQYAYRPDRNAHDAIRQVHGLLKTGHTQVVDADLAAYFDSDPACRTDEIGGAPDRRSASVTSDQDVARSTGRGDRRAGWKEAYDPAA